MVTVNSEIGIASQVANDVVKGAACECYNCPAFGTNQMMPMTGLTDDVRRMTAGLQQSCQHIDRSQNFERPIDCGSSNLWHLGDKLLCGKWALAAEHGRYNPTAWRRHPVAMFEEERVDIRRPKRRQRRIHDKRVAQAFNRAVERRVIIDWLMELLQTTWVLCWLIGSLGVKR
jgi:hypothetical protein